VRTDTTAAPRERCDRCGGPLTGRRQIRTRRLCSTACRAAWHRARKVALQQEAAELLKRCAAIIEELAASNG
jgi:hypothetical protein